MGEQFDLNIFVNDLDADWRMVGVEFKIRYNLTMLQITNITEGGFMKHFAGLAGTDTFFQFYVEEDPMSGYGVVGIMILPLVNGTWPGPFPDTTDYGAPGDLAAATFNTTYQHEELDLNSTIWLDEIILANKEAGQIPIDETKTEEEGKCLYTITRAIVLPDPLKPFAVPEMGRWIDVITFNYPKGFNGAGKDAGSDAFSPQTEVVLKALVTHNLDPVEDKLVTFEIFEGNNTSYARLTGMTDEYGIATVVFRIPSWNKEDNTTSVVVEGKWRVEAVAEIAGERTGDVVAFNVGWLVNFEPAPSLTITKEKPFASVNVSIRYYTLAAQEVDANITFVLLDDVGVPVYRSETTIHFPRNESAIGTLRYDDKEITIQVPTWAYAGKASLRLNAFGRVCMLFEEYDPSVLRYESYYPFCREGIIPVTLEPMTTWPEE